MWRNKSNAILPQNVQNDHRRCAAVQSAKSIWLACSTCSSRRRSPVGRQYHRRLLVWQAHRPPLAARQTVRSHGHLRNKYTTTDKTTSNDYKLQSIISGLLICSLLRCGPCDNFCHLGHTKNSDDDNNDNDGETYFWTRNWSHIATHLVVVVVVSFLLVQRFSKSPWLCRFKSGWNLAGLFCILK